MNFIKKITRAQFKFKFAFWQIFSLDKSHKTCLHKQFDKLESSIADLAHQYHLKVAYK